MIFRILCGEWIEPLWDCMKAQEDENNVSLIPSWGLKDSSFYVFISYYFILLVEGIVHPLIHSCACHGELPHLELVPRVAPQLLQF